MLFHLGDLAFDCYLVTHGMQEDYSINCNLLTSRDKKNLFVEILPIIAIVRWLIVLSVCVKDAMLASAKCIRLSLPFQN